MAKCAKRLAMIENDEHNAISMTCNNRKAGRITIQMEGGPDLATFQNPSEMQILQWLQAFEAGLIVAGLD